MAITGNDLLKMRRGSTNDDEKDKEKSSNKLTGEDLLNRRKAYQNADIDIVDQKYIDSFINDANTFITTTEKEYGSWEDIRTRADTIGAWLYKNRNGIDGEAYKSLNSYLDNIRSATDYYSQFTTEDDYKKYRIGWLDTESQADADIVAKRQEYYDSNQKQIDDINEDLPWYANTWLPNWVEDVFLSKDNEALRDEAEARKAENLQYDRTQGVTDKYYTPITEEFKQNAAYRDYSNASMEELWNYDAIVKDIKVKNLGYDFDGNMVDAGGNIVYDANHPIVKAMRENNLDGFYDTLIEDKLGMYLSATQEDLETAYQRLIGGGNEDDTWAILLNEGETHAWKELTEGEIDIYYNLYKTQGQSAAYQYLKDMETELTRRATQKRADEIGEAGFLKQIALNVASIPMNVFGGLVGAMGDVADAIQGEEYNPYSAAHSWSNDAEAIRKDTAQDINNATGNIALPWVGTTFGDVYQNLMSFGDSVMASVIPGGAILLGTNAATMEMKDLYERGGSTEQILSGGILAGAAEMLFESLSIGELKKIKNMDYKAAKTWVDVFVRGTIMGGVEASEEMFTEIANAISDALVMGSQSDWVDFETFAKNVVNAGIGGFISGGFGGTIAASANKLQYNKSVTEHGQAIIDNRGTDSLKQLALEMTGAIGDKSITKAVGKVEKNATAKNVGKLSAKMENSITAQNRSVMESALVMNGISKKEASLASAYLTNSSELTEQQVAEIESNERLQSAIDKVISDPQLNISDNSMKLNFARNGIQIGKPTTQQSDSTAQPPEEESVTKNPTAKENATEPKYEASTDGKTKIGDMEVSIKEIASVKDGEVTLRLDDGSTVSANDVEYGSTEEGLLYENVADMNLNAATANAFIKGYDPSMTVDQYAKGFQEAYRYGEYGFPVQEMSKDGFSAMLTESQKSLAYNLGKTDAKYKVESKQAKIASTSAIKSENIASKGKKKGKLHNTLTPTNERQRASLKTLGVLAEALGIDIYTFESPVVNGTRQGANGWFDPSDNSIHIDLYAGATGEGTMLFTAAHELTHFIRMWSPTKFKVFADFLLEKYGEKGVSLSELIAERIEMLEAKGRTKGKTEAEIYDLAYEEIIADSCEAMLADGDVVAKIAELKAKDKTLWEKIKDFITNLVARIKSAYEGMKPDSAEGQFVAKMLDTAEQLKALWTEALLDASEAQSVAPSLLFAEESTDVVSVEDATLYSYRSLAEAAGFEAVENEDGSRMFTRDGKRVSEVTVEDIENSPIGAFINYSVEMKDITEADAKKQKEMFAKICTMACQTNDFAMAMQFVGSAVFTGMKANADKQYGTTYDFPSICTKTQAVIDAMSKRMVTLGRGLSTKEIEGIYRDVFASGNPVPCPECYVFSRWIGIGGLLDNIKKYQDYYGDMSVAEVAKAYKEMHSQVSAFAEEQKITFGKAKGALTSKLTKEYNKLTEKIEKQENQGEKVNEADRKRLAEIEPMMNTVKAMTWIENVYFADSALTKVNPKFRVPNDVLFDLNNGEAFATEYKEAWAFRTTQGAGYGKAITPYAEARLGEGILVTNNTTNAIKGKAKGVLNNYFLKQNGQMDAQAKKALATARVKQKNQAFMGGQRFQSTSDGRYENASDYLLAALEMQAMHGMVQVYTKVDGAVAAFETWGFSTNQSLMPKGGGLDANGNVQDTSVGGMHPRVATENRNKHEHAGTITIGVNDNHIRALYKEVNRDFVIPYHASGGKADVVATFRTIQEGMEKMGKMVRSTDYSRTQSDKVLSDEVLAWLGKTDAEIEQIHKVREARIGILTRGKVDMDVVRGNRFLSALYDKLHGGEWDGVKLAKGKVQSQIFPNEFWDQSVSYEESGKVTKDYLEYCEDLGFLHRFSGLVPSNGKLVPVKGYDENGNRVTLTDLAYKYDENGQNTDVTEDFYWKNITDRRMYGHNGQYLPQKYVTLTDTTTDTVTTFAKNNYGRQYDKKVSLETAEKVAEKKYSDRILMGSLFSGGGTLEAGLAYQMLDKEFGVEYDGKIASVYADNHGDHIQVGRVEDFDISKYDDIFYLHASPVCHNFSKAKHGAKELQMDIDSAKATAKHLETAMPQVFTVENAPGYRKSQSLKIITDKLTELGYKWDVDVYNSADYGSATSRNRVILRAVKDGELPAKPTKQERTNSWDKTTRDLWDTLPKSYLRPSFISAIENTPKLPILDANGKVNVNKPLLILTTTSGHMVTYCWEGEICPTLTTKCGEAKLVMPDGNIYAVTPEFMGRIQGLPDDYKYPKAKTRAFTIIGNGIPTHLTKAVVGGVLDSAYEQTHDGKVLYSDRNTETAPTFYSYMGKVVDGIKSEKVGANGVVPYLKGKGVKAEEIKWSGIEAFLEGKKSVAKVELQEFVAGSQLTIEEEMSGDKPWVLEKDGDDYIIKDKDGRVLDTWEATEAPDDPDLKGWSQYDKDFPTDTFGENKYSDRTTDSFSNRSLLANALESVAQNDIERKKLEQYKAKIDLINSEQAKLSEIRAKVKELSFAKGRRDTEAIKKLQFEANQTANRINTYDKQLLNLESTQALKDVLQREKEMARKRAEQKGKETLAAYRERASKTQRELLTRYQESRKKNVEGRKKTEMRLKIKKINSELNTLLLNPTSKKYIQEELRKEVANALDAFNMDTVGAEERLAEINRKLQKASDPYEIEHLLESYRRISLQGEKLADRLNALKSAYEKIKATDDIELNLSYQEAIHNSIEAVSKEVGNTSIRNMSLEQLDMVYDLFKMIRQTIRNANKAFKEQKGQTIMQMAEAVNDQVRTVGGEPYKHNVISSWLQKEGWHLLKPYVAFRTIGSVTLTNLYKELRNGEDTFYGDVKEAQAFIEKQYEKYNYKSWDMKQTKTFTAKSGKSFDLTLEQMMTLYAYSRRDQAHKHIMEGGIVFDDAVIVEKNKWGVPIKYEVTTKAAFNLSEETLGEIVDSLTSEQRAFVDEMQRYLSVTMGAKGNEVSMELLGVKLFKEEFYLPIKSSHYYRNFNAEEAGEVKLRSPAFSKETVPHANNPIVLHNFTDLWAEHINDMSMYHSFVLALEDFTRVYNYKTKTDAKVETMDTKATIETAYPGATAYISKFLKDLNGGVRGETVGWAEKLTSLAKKGAVLGSASVAIQQSSAIMRAMAYVNPKYFAVTTHKSLNLAKHNQDMAELKKYAPIAGIKEMGRFDVGMGQGTVDWIKSNKTLMNKAEDVLSVAPAFMDEVAWVSIWNAVKRETLHTHKDLKPNSEEFLKAVGERFTDVISLSQVYDSVFSRSDLMRNKSLVAKWITSFMAEPTTTLNMLWDSWVQGKRTGNWKGFVKVTSKAASAVLSAIVLNSALKAIVMAGRDDDEDESYAEKYLEHFFGDLKDNLNPLTLIPVVKDVLSIFDGYDVERMDMALISDLKQALDAFDSDNKTAYEKWSGLIGAISAMFGVPVKNVERDIRAVINTIFGDAEATTKAGLGNAIEEGWTGDKKSNGQQLYEAMLSGDSAQIERVESRFEDQNAINSAIRKALRENEPRIKEAAEAVVNGDYAEYNRIFEGIMGEGNFSKADIKAAIDSEVSELKPKEEKEPTESKEVSIYEVEYVFNEIVYGNGIMAHAMKEEIIRTHEANGKDRDEAEASFNNSFTTYVKKHYGEGDISAYEAENMLVNYAGKTSEDASSKVKYWAFQNEYPDYDDLTESAVSKYYEYAEPYGIGVAVYYDYSKQRAKCKGTDANGDGKTDRDSVKSQVMAVINSLPITYEQKDALYYLNGWSASTIWEAPWH